MNGLFVCAWCLGTTVVMYYGDDDVYRIHLHPGRDHYWSEVLLRASSVVSITFLIADFCNYFQV